MDKLQELEKRIEILESLVIPDKNKIVTGLDLQKVTYDDLIPWIEKKQAEGRVFTICIETALGHCKDYFLDRKRTIKTVYNWINSTQDSQPKPFHDEDGGEPVDYRS